MAGLNGKVGIVTGAAAGLGRAIAERLIGDGVSVLLVDIDPAVAATAAALGERAAAITVDVRSGAEVAGMIDHAVSRFGRLDILCNNAGIEAPHVPMTDCTEEDFDRCIAVDLKGVFLGMKHALKVMIPQRSGAIVNIASLIAERAMPTQGPYCSAKAGVLALTRVAAIEAGPAGVRVNAINPGGMRTGMAARALSHDPGAETRWAERFPLKRLADPAEVANVVAFLASDEAAYITGATIAVDGGWGAIA